MTPLWTFLSRTSYHDSYSKPYDGIRWIFETHIKEPDTKEYNFAVLFGNEDAPTRIDLFKSHWPISTSNPDRVWEAPETHSMWPRSAAR